MTDKDELHRSQHASGDSASDIGSAKDRLSKEAASASSTLHDARDAVKSEAAKLGKQARHSAEHGAETIKEEAASNLHVFADALRAASDELAEKQSGPAGEMISQAAAGLENLSRSLHGKSTAEMLNSVRDFGRQNPIGFIAGSVLAGLAVGRFAAAATPGATGDTQKVPNRSADDIVGGGRTGSADPVRGFGR